MIPSLYKFLREPVGLLTLGAYRWKGSLLDDVTNILVGMK